MKARRVGLRLHTPIGSLARDGPGLFVSFLKVRGVQMRAVCLSVTREGAMCVVSGAITRGEDQVQGHSLGDAECTLP